MPLFNDQIISMYGCGMTDREIRGHLEEIYDVEVSPDLISRVTNAVLDEVREWQGRPLDKFYAIVYLDALRAVYPQTRVQLCIVRMVRNSTKFVSYQGS